MASPKREYTPEQQKLLDVLAGEAKGDIAKAKVLAGYSPNTSTSRIIESLRDEILQIANDILVSNAPKAALGLAGLLDTPDAMGARNKINTASAILDRVGIVKKEQVEHKVEGAKIFILPPKDPS